VSKASAAREVRGYAPGKFNIGSSKNDVCDIFQAAVS